MLQPAVPWRLFLLLQSLIGLSVSEAYVQKILSSYDKFEQPKELNIMLNRQNKNVTTLTCLMQMMWLFEVDATQNEYSALMNLHCEWYDHRLSWSLSELNESSIQLPANMVWFPTITFHGFQTPYTVMPNIVTIFQTGRVAFTYSNKENETF